VGACLVLTVSLFVLFAYVSFKKDKKSAKKIKNIGKTILKKTIKEIENLINNEFKKT